mmetsp:Transcript_15782/g.53163  ORF Transcript_15782/g.53163 Transcript_15782/m.53163 type:complete len:283 (-) Transcript_15782:635-1483(-)
MCTLELNTGRAPSRSTCSSAETLLIISSMFFLSKSTYGPMNGSKTVESSPSTGFSSSRAFAAFSAAAKSAAESSPNRRGCGFDGASSSRPPRLREAPYSSSKRACASFSKTKDFCKAFSTTVTFSESGSPEARISRNMALVWSTKSKTSLRSTRQGRGNIVPYFSPKVRSSRRTQENRRSTSSKPLPWPPFGKRNAYGSSCRATNAATCRARASSPRASTTAHASPIDWNPPGAACGASTPVSAMVPARWPMATNASKTSSSIFSRICSTSTFRSRMRSTSP